MVETLAPLHLPGVILAEQTHLRIPSRPECVGPTAEFLRRKAVLCGACLETRSDRLLAALHEAISNAVVHGNLEVTAELADCNGHRSFAAAVAARAADPRYACRCVDIEVIYTGRCCEWTLTQEGPGFDPERALARQPGAEGTEGQAGGRGLLMMRAFLDEVRYAARGRQVTLTLHQAVAEEKRQDVRRPLRGRVHVAPLRADGSPDRDTAQDAVARNVSRGGVGLLLSRPAPAERVLLGLAGAGQTLYLPAEVRHGRPVGENEVEVGCRFLPPSEGPGETAGREALAGVVERAGRRAAADERRAHPRFTYTERLAVLGAAGGPPVSGHGRDLSKGGIAFVTRAPLPPGVRVLELPQAGGKRPLRIRARVLRCDGVADGFHEAAARFLCLEA